MRIGFTGTQQGMNDFQTENVVNKLVEIVKANHKELVFVHGDCVGSDEEVATLARELGFYIIGRPALVAEHKRAYFKCDTLFPAKAPLDRNQDIVDNSDMLIATPKEQSEVLRSGTWSTIRRAKKANLDRYIVGPYQTIIF